jgi:hypothetical protein
MTTDNGMGGRAGSPRGGTPRYIFQVDRGPDGAVIRVLDTQSGDTFREIPIAEFVAYAKQNRDVRPLLLGLGPIAD